MQCFVLHVFRHTLFFTVKDFYMQLWNLNSLYAERPERPWEAQNLNNDAMAWQKDSNWAHLLWKSFRRVKEILWDASPV